MLLLKEDECGTWKAWSKDHVNYLYELNKNLAVKVHCLGPNAISILATITTYGRQAFRSVPRC